VMLVPLVIVLFTSLKTSAEADGTGGALQAPEN